MKVLKKGNVKDAWKLQVRCTGKGNASANENARVIPCESVLEVGCEDIFNAPNFGGSMSDDYTIKCIECGALTDIPEKEISEEVKTYARTNEIQKAGKLSRSTITKKTEIKEKGE